MINRAKNIILIGFTVMVGAVAMANVENLVVDRDDVSSAAMTSYPLSAWICAVALFIALIIIDLFLSRETSSADVGMMEKMDCAKKKSINYKNGNDAENRDRKLGECDGNNRFECKKINSRHLFAITISIASALIFGCAIYSYHPSDGIAFLTGYLVELSLSVDNVFVFLLIFDRFALSQDMQQKILLIGIISAIFLRFIMIFLGIEILERFAWLMYVFGAILIYLGWRIAWKKIVERYWRADIDEKIEMKDDNDGVLLRCIKKYLPINLKVKTTKFILNDGKKYFITANLVALILVENADLIFALDSIPAVIGITNNLFIVFTSNIMAIVSLRSMYFLAAKYMKKLEYLQYSLAVVLMFIGAKIICEGLGYIHIHHAASLLIILSILVLPALFNFACSEKKNSTNEES